MKSRMRANRWRTVVLGVVTVAGALVGTQSSAATHAPAGVTCDGDGQSGQRVQLIYVRGESDADRYGEYAPQFQSWAGTIDDYINQAAQDTGGERHVRYVHDGGCQPIVDNVVLSDDQMTDAQGIADVLTNQKGYNRDDRDYLVWYERTGCGLSFGGAGDDSPGDDNGYNKGNHFATIGTDCWGWAPSGHELLHAFGAVQASAPHATPYGHCWDDEDIMCYDDGGLPEGGLQKLCPGADENQVDCNKDDYFNVNPPDGSYLATHWNVARNKFLIGA